MPPTALGGFSGGPADHAAEHREHTRLRIRVAGRWRTVERSEALRHVAQACRCVLGRKRSGEQSIEGEVPDRGDITSRWPREDRHITIASAAAGHRVTPAADNIWARRRRPRWAAIRTAPGLRPTIWATASLSRSATTRSRITSACRDGSAETALTISAVARFTIASAAASGVVGSRAGCSSSSGATGWRDRRRLSSIARRLAIVNSHALQADSSPRKRGKPRTTCTQVSEATSSIAPGAVTQRYRSKTGLASRYSSEKAASLPA